MLGKPVLAAPADHPAEACIVRALSGFGYGDRLIPEALPYGEVFRLPEPRPAEAAGAVEKEVLRHQPADPAARGTQHVELVASGSGLTDCNTLHYCRLGVALVALDIGSIGIDLDAGNPAAVLPVIAEVAAEDRAAGADIAQREHTEAKPRVLAEAVVAPAVAGMAANVEAGPVVINRSGPRCLERHVGRLSNTRDQQTGQHRSTQQELRH